MAELSPDASERPSEVALVDKSINTVPLLRLLQRRQVTARPLGRFLPRSLHGSFAFRSAVSSDSQVFNLEWTSTGARVIAALENGGVRFWDPLSPRISNCIGRAHTNCVNIVRLSGEHHFWTGSDDCTIKQWDLRRLDTATRHFHGHNNWVKTIDLMGENQLLTAAFDGTVRVWDVAKDYPEGGAPDNTIFFSEHLTRARLHNNMLALSVGNNLILVHDLDLDTISWLRNLNVKGLLRGSEKCTLPVVALGDYNRVEVLREESGGVGMSLQFSACGRYLLSRRRENSNEACLIYDLTTDENVEAALLEAQEIPVSATGGAKLSNRLLKKLWPDRLVYHIPDSGAGRGFIKEPSISRCSQMIASPYYRGYGWAAMSTDSTAFGYLTSVDRLLPSRLSCCYTRRC